MGHLWPGMPATLTVGHSYECKTFNTCILKFLRPQHFVDFGDLDYHATVDPENAANVAIEPVSGGIMITGLKSTAKEDDAGMMQNRFGEGMESITVSVTASDSEGLTSADPLTFKVVVDGQPTSTLPTTLAVITVPRLLTLNLYFDDDDVRSPMSMSTFESPDDDAAVDTAAKCVEASISDDVLTLAPGEGNNCSREVTVVATEGGSVGSAVDRGQCPSVRRERSS